MAEALCLRSIHAPTMSFSYARYYCSHYCSNSYCSSPALLLTMKNRGDSPGFSSRSQDIRHGPPPHPIHGVSSHIQISASIASFPGLLCLHRHHNHVVCHKKKACLGKEGLYIHALPSHGFSITNARSCNGLRGVMFGGWPSSSSSLSSLSFFQSPLSGASHGISLRTECGAMPTIPSHSEGNVERNLLGNTKVISEIEYLEGCSEETSLLMAEDDVDGNVCRLEPPILKCGMDLPQKWNIPGGTVVLMDKPKGWTSFTVCAKIRKLVQVKKVGHAGTLDPMATGLLVVCVGPATKLADSFQALVKVYTGTFRLGEATSSCDADSPIIERKSWEHITDTDIQTVKERFVGEIMQIPPMFSAIKIHALYTGNEYCSDVGCWASIPHFLLRSIEQVEGERLYEKARRGEKIDVPARKITIYDFQIERNKEDRQQLDFYVRCSKGTYIRSLCADMGRALNSCAHLTKLRREKIGDLSVDDAWQFQDLAETYSSLYGA